MLCTIHIIATNTYTLETYWLIRTRTRPHAHTHALTHGIMTEGKKNRHEKKKKYTFIYTISHVCVCVCVVCAREKMKFVCMKMASNISNEKLTVKLIPSTEPIAKHLSPTLQAPLNIWWQSIMLNKLICYILYFFFLFCFLPGKCCVCALLLFSLFSIDELTRRTTFTLRLIHWR